MTFLPHYPRFLLPSVSNDGQVLFPWKSQILPPGRFPSSALLQGHLERGAQATAVSVSGWYLHIVQSHA